MSKVLVTGSTGFLGPKVIQYLNKAGYKVKAMVRDLNKANSMNLGADELVVGDITKAETLKNIASNCDYVVNLAVLGHSYEDRLGIHDYRKVNVDGIRNLLEAVKDVKLKKIVLISSSAAVGLVSEEVITENVIPNPQTPYGVSKMESDLLINEYYKKYKLPVVTVRFTHVYGPGDTRDFLKIVRMVKKGIFPIVGFGPNLYPAVYKDDAARSILLALEKGRVGELYNITDKESHDLREISSIIRTELHVKAPRLWIPRLSSIFALTLLESLGFKLPVKSKNIKFVTSARKYSIDKAREELDYSPQVSLEEGLKKTLRYYKENKLI